MDSAECIQYDETVVAPQNSFETGPAAGRRLVDPGVPPRALATKKKVRSARVKIDTPNGPAEGPAATTTLSSLETTNDEKEGPGPTAHDLFPGMHMPM